MPASRLRVHGFHLCDLTEAYLAEGLAWLLVKAKDAACVRRPKIAFDFLGPKQARPRGIGNDQGHISPLRPSLGRAANNRSRFMWPENFRPCSHVFRDGILDHVVSTKVCRDLHLVQTTEEVRVKNGQITIVRRLDRLPKCASRVEAFS